MAEKPTSKPIVTSDLFKDSFLIGDKGMGRRAFSFTIAFLLIFSIMAAMVVLPLLGSTNLPEVEVYSAFLAPPPPPHHLLLPLLKKPVPNAQEHALSLFRLKPTSNPVSS